MIGTGLFVSLGIATDLSGSWVLIALILAAAIV
jgi:L-asparagine transporter-like permease